MSAGVPAALSHDSLFAKSIVYIRRAFRARGEGELEEYQLWASLSLELLGKACLAKVHPCLIADPSHSASMFAAAGIPYASDVKTIGAKTVFERLHHVDLAFDSAYQRFGEQMAIRRNAELHSGEAPFMATRASAWEIEFWGAANVILHAMGESLDSWLGNVEGAKQTGFIKQAEEALMWEIANRIIRAREAFQATCPNPKARQAKLDASHSMSARQNEDLIQHSFDYLDLTECPACGGLGVRANNMIGEEISGGPDDDEPWGEWVTTTYAVEEFACPVCGLKLHSHREVKASKMASEIETEESRLLEYEPDYGND